MAKQPTTQELQELKDKKLSMTLDAYYEQYVMPNSNGQQVRSNTHTMKLPLEKYYVNFVLPKQERQARYYQYKRTHYFAPSYLKKRQSRQPESAGKETEDKQAK